MNLQDLYDYYTRRNSEEFTRQTANEAVDEIISGFGDWDTDRIGALMLDLSMILAIKRGREGQDILVAALGNLDSLVGHYKKTRREMN